MASRIVSLPVFSWIHVLFHASIWRNPDSKKLKLTTFFIFNNFQNTENIIQLKMYGHLEESWNISQKCISITHLRLSNAIGWMVVPTKYVLSWSLKPMSVILFRKRILWLCKKGQADIKAYKLFGYLCYLLLGYSHFERIRVIKLLLLIY